MSEENKVIDQEEVMEESSEIDETTEVIEQKESLITKGKRFMKDNKQKILGLGLAAVAGLVGYALGSGKPNDSNNDGEIIDVDDYTTTDVNDSDESPEEN